jgi:hypothetical protein
MSFRASKWAVKQRTGSGVAKAVLLILAEAADAERRCFPSHATIAARAEVSERAVLTAMAALEHRGLIRRQPRRDRRGHRTSDLITLQVDNQSGEAPTADQTARRAVRDGPAQTAGDAARLAIDLTANCAAPNRGSRQSLTAPRAEEPVRGEQVSEQVSDRRARALPADFPTEAKIIEAQDRFDGLGLAIDARLEAEKFRHHHTAKGTRSKSWGSSWGTWTVNAIGFAKRDGSRFAPNQRQSAISGWALRGETE